MNLLLLCLLACATLALAADQRLDDVSFDEPTADEADRDYPNALEYEPSDADAEPNVAEAEPNVADRPQDGGVHAALAAAMRRPGMQIKMAEVMPIVRVMSPPQRLALAALLTSQMLSPSSPTLREVSAMFGSDGSAADASRLLLPISFDIARIFRGGRAQGRGFRRDHAHVFAEMVPPPPPRRTPADRRSDSFDRRSESIDRRSESIDRRSESIDRRSESIDRRPQDCVFFSSSVCLEVSDYPGAQIAASLRRASDAMDDALLPRSRDLLPEPSDNRRQDGGALPAAAAMCESTTKMARPKKARSTSGEWKFIVNTARHVQTLRLEVCSKPQGACAFISDNFASECAQVFNYHRLLAWDEPRGLHMDIFKVPTCCSCQVRGYANSFPPSPVISHAHDSHASGSLAQSNRVPARGQPIRAEDVFVGNAHDDETFVVQGSPLQGAFEALPGDEADLLRRGAAIEQALFDRQAQRAATARRPGLSLRLVPPPGPPPSQHDFVENNIRRTRNQSHAELPYQQHVGVSRIPAIPLSRPSPPDVARRPPSPAVTSSVTSSVTSLPPPPPRDRSAAAPSGEKVNYSYHPIIDFFSSRHLESRSGEGWTPIVATTS